MYLAQPGEGMRGRALVMAFAAFPHCVPPRPLVRLRNGNGTPFCKYQVSLPVRVAPNTGLARGTPWVPRGRSLPVPRMHRWSCIHLRDGGQGCRFHLPEIFARPGTFVCLLRQKAPRKAPTLPLCALCLSGERGPAMRGFKKAVVPSAPPFPCARMPVESRRTSICAPT